MIRRSGWWLGAVAGGAWILFVAGCDSRGNRGELHGTVTLDGTPIAQGSILLVPIEQTAGEVTGGAIQDGAYRLAGPASPLAGRYRVEIRAVRKSGKMIQKPFSPPGQLTEEYVEAVAARFNSASTLTVDVKAGDNTADFPVTAQ